MLDYCAEHGVAAEIELVTGDRINESWESVLSQDVRYRYVLDTGTLAQGSRSEAKVRSITDRSSTR